MSGTSTLPVVFLGPEASYSHQAALKAFPNTPLLPQTKFPALFDLLQSKRASHAVLPIENSTNGPVAGALDLLASSAQTYPSVRILGEVRVRIQHSLVATPASLSSHPKAAPPPSYPSTPLQWDPACPTQRALLARLRCLYSHNQVWGQVKHFLAAADAAGAEQGAPPAPRVDVGSTSAAARMMAEVATSTETRAVSGMDGTATPPPEEAEEANADETRARPGSAAISSAMAARLHGADVLIEGIEDAADNVTRFVILGNVEEVGELRLRGTGTTKAMVVFDLRRGEDGKSNAGALAGALDVFRREGLSLTSINARPSGRGPAWDYWFVVECEVPAGAEGAVERVVEGLGEVAGSCGARGQWVYESLDGL